MTRAKFLALAARVEAAAEGDAFLDEKICAATVGLRGDIDAPAYTSSLDAAASLVPEDWRWSVETLSSAGPLGLCEHWPQSGQRHPYTRGEAATPALALTAAALRARAEEVNDAD